MEKRCFVCMNPIHSAVCGHCGHNNSDAEKHAAPDLLAPGSVVGGRYEAGVALDRNGEGATYIAYDETEQVRVRLREFFPGTLCHRETDGSINVNTGREIQFKALMTDFVELSKQLMELTSNNNLLRTRDILACGGTIYVAYEDVRGVVLPKFLRDNRGDLSWEETENLFLPLLYTVKLLNTHGIIHRGISPENIVITESRELKLKGVCTSSVRAINSEVKPELFDGYAALEQYEKCASHGEWTDVYAVCAVLYRVLTGVTPPRADSREESDNLRPPVELNPLIPRTVSNAIMRGLALERNVRTHSIKDLIGDLYAAAPAKKAMTAPRHITDEEDEEEYEEPRRRKNNPSGRTPSPQPMKKKKKRRVPIWLIVILVTLPLMLGIFFLTYYYVLGDGASGASSLTSSDLAGSMPSSELPSAPPVSSEPPVSKLPQVMVDNFIGKDYEDLKNSTSYQDTFIFTADEKFDDFVLSGEVISQSVEGGSIVDKGTEIKLVVSKGMQKVTIPPAVGPDGAKIAAEDLKKYLEEQGIQVAVEQIDEPGYVAGDVIRTSPDAGAVLDRAQSNDVTIYIALSTFE